MHDDGTSEVMELLAECCLEPGLDAECLVPGDTLEEGIDEADQKEGGDQLRIEFRPLGDAAGNDGRDGGCEGKQEEELGQLEAVLLHQRLDTAEEIDAVGDAVANEEVGHGGHAKVVRILTSALT